MIKNSLLGKFVIGMTVGTFLSFTAIAQGPDPGDDPDNPPAPVDGGIALLIAAGVGYGAKKLYDVKSKKNDEVS